MMLSQQRIFDLAAKHLLSLGYMPSPKYFTEYGTPCCGVGAVLAEIPNAKNIIMDLKANGSGVLFLSHEPFLSRKLDFDNNKYLLMHIQRVSDGSSRSTLLPNLRELAETHNLDTGVLDAYISSDIK